MREYHRASSTLFRRRKGTSAVRIAQREDCGRDAERIGVFLEAAKFGTGLLLRSDSSPKLHTTAFDAHAICTG
jgi:hypothetical protein